MREKAIHNYISGAMAGSASLFVGYPFDTVKVHIQAQKSSTQYHGLRHSFINIGKQGLIRGFFRGLSWPLASNAATSSVFFGVYGNTLKYLESDREKRKTFYSKICLAGCLGGLATLPLYIPIEYVKVVLQSQIPHDAQGRTVTAVNTTSNRYYRGPLHCARHVFRENGISGFTKGSTLTALREVSYFSIYCPIYAFLKHNLTTHGWTDSNGIAADFFGGGLAGVITWCCVIPIDVIKTRIQADSEQRFKGTIDCIVQSYKESGVRIFYRGCLVTCLRAFPVNATGFMVYSQTTRFLEESDF